MAPRHAAEMTDSRHRLRHHQVVDHDESIRLFDDEDDPFGTNARDIDPFDEQNYDDSFENDLNNTYHGAGEKQQQQQQQTRKSSRSSTRDSSSRKLRSSGRRGSVGSTTTGSRRMNGSSSRLNGSMSRMHDSSTRVGSGARGERGGGMDDSNSRFMNDDSTSRRGMGESRSRLGDSSRRLGESSRRMGESSRRRRGEGGGTRTPKPNHPATFPKNGTRRASNGMRERERDPSSRHSKRGSGAPPALSSMDNSKQRPTNTRSRSRRSIGESSHGKNDHSSSGRRDSSLATALKESQRLGSSRDLGMSSSSLQHHPLSPGEVGSRRSSTASRTADGKGPSPRSSRRGSVTSSLRDALGNSEARSRIRKEAVRKQKREQQQEEERKLNRQKAKLARQKERTNELLGRKLARLDVKNGDTANKRDTVVEDEKSQGSKGMESTSVHRQSQRRSRRRTHLSHNILVRNMNQMTVPRLSEAEEEDEEDHHVYEEEHHNEGIRLPEGIREPFIEDEFDQDEDNDDYYHDDDEEMTLEADNLQHHSSSTSIGNAADHARKEAWQRRLERQQRE